MQVVSHIDPGQSARLAAILPKVRRVQVIHVEDEGALDLIEAYAPHVHAFLLDSGRPGLPTPELGGTGRVHDWALSAEFVRRSPRPVFLAGGLTPANVGEAIRTVRPYGLDLCSGVRTDGRLDPDKLAVFVTATRATDVLLEDSTPHEAVPDSDPVDRLARELWEAHATHHQPVIPFPQEHWDQVCPFTLDHWRHIAPTAIAFGPTGGKGATVAAAGLDAER